MAATHSQLKTKTSLLAQLKIDFPGIKFRAGENFMWSPEEKAVYYPRTKTETYAYSLLHELGHGIHEHTTFKSDIQLLELERDAWDKAVELAGVYDVTIPTDHIEECMDTYRDWLYARSLCPYCKQCGLQTAKTAYSCVFCEKSWKVSESRLCKVVRRMVSDEKKG